MAGNMSHAYLTAHGEFFGASPWVGEFGQMGIRVAFADVNAVPARGSTFTIPENGDTVADSGSASGTHGTLTRAFKARLGGTGSTENLDAALQVDLAEDFWTFLSAVAFYQHQTFRWTHIKIAGCDVDGKYSTPGSIYGITSPIVGGRSGSCMPPEVALAMSLQAPVVGRSGRGRMFLPALTSSSTLATADGLVDGSAAAALAGSLNTFIDDLDNLPGLAEFSGVTIVTSAGKATAVRPTRTRVGSHFDVQRSRQHQVKETYAESVL